jgi:hypothetical protein
MGHPPAKTTVINTPIRAASYTMIFLRQDKILRDHGDELSTGVIGMTDEARAMTWRWP